LLLTRHCNPVSHMHGEGTARGANIGGGRKSKKLTP